jgi:N-acetylglucosamine kinase-like BadF-type ATPase
MDNLLSVFSKNLRDRRCELGLTQKSLGEMLGYTEKAVSKWERGLSLPPSFLLPSLSAVLETGIDALMSENAEILYYLGIYGSGSKSDFVLADKTGKIIKRAVLESANPNDVGIENCLQVLNKGILEVLNGLPLRNVSVFAGLSGGITGDNKNIIAEHLKRYSFGAVENGSDGHNAVALGLGKRDGIAVIMETGVMAYARCNGKLHRLGGFGYLFGDKGGAFSIGRDALNAALKEECGYQENSHLIELVKNKCGGSVLGSLSSFYNESKRLVASYAPLVFEAFEKNDKLAEGIIIENMFSVAELIKAASSFLENKRDIPVVLCGNIPSTQPVVLPMLENALREKPESYKVEIMKTPMVYGSLLLAGLEKDYNTEE